MLSILKAMLLVMAWTLCGFSHAQPTDISFYFPIAVGGPVAKTISALTADFEKDNPDIRVKPTYTGTYKDSIVKALAAHRSGAPPDVAVLFAVDMFTLIDAQAILPFDDLVTNADDVAWMRSFYPCTHGQQPRGRTDLGHSLPALHHSAVLE